MATTSTKTKKEMTLLLAIERVVELAEDSKMSKEFMKMLCRCSLLTAITSELMRKVLRR
jgi:hypothetical protein